MLLNMCFIISSYLKMMLPLFGKFTNEMYDIVVVMWLGRLYDMKPQFFKL